MRIKYDIDTNKTTSWIESFGGVNEIFKSEFEIVWIGYIIKYGFIDHFLKNEHTTDYLKLEGFDKFYGNAVPRGGLTKEATQWLQIGTDFMLTNYRDYIILFLQKKEEFVWGKENKVIRQYVIDNKEEFPDAYLELLL